MDIWSVVYTVGVSLLVSSFIAVLVVGAKQLFGRRKKRK